MGFTTLEINALEQLPDLERFVQFVFDKEERNRKINEAICNEYSLSTQIAILRKGLVNLGCKDKDFVEFNAKVEEIKKRF